jgi:hypothetical protein
VFRKSMLGFPAKRTQVFFRLEPRHRLTAGF